MLALTQMDRVVIIVSGLALVPALYVIWFGLRGGSFFTECRWRSWGKLIQSDIYAAMLEGVHARFGPKGVRYFMIGFGAVAIGGILAITWLNLTKGPGTW